MSDGGLADEQLRGDVAVAVPLADQPGDLHLWRSQHIGGLDAALRACSRCVQLAAGRAAKILAFGSCCEQVPVQVLRVGSCCERGTSSSAAATADQGTDQGLPRSRRARRGPACSATVVAVALTDATSLVQNESGRPAMTTYLINHLRCGSCRRRHGHRVGGHDLPHGLRAQPGLRHRPLAFRGGRADQEPADEGEPQPAVLAPCQDEERSHRDEGPPEHLPGPGGPDS